jgi:hypothetical protein
MVTVSFKKHSCSVESISIIEEWKREGTRTVILCLELSASNNRSHNVMKNAQQTESDSYVEGYIKKSCTELIMKYVFTFDPGHYYLSQKDSTFFLLHVDYSAVFLNFRDIFKIMH